MVIHRYIHSSPLDFGTLEGACQQHSQKASLIWRDLVYHLPNYVTIFILSARVRAGFITEAPVCKYYTRTIGTHNSFNFAVIFVLNTLNKGSIARPWVVCFLGKEILHIYAVVLCRTAYNLWLPESFHQLIFYRNSNSMEDTVNLQTDSEENHSYNMWSLIHAGTKVKPCCKMIPRIFNGILFMSKFGSGIGLWLIRPFHGLFAQH